MKNVTKFNLRITTKRHEHLQTLQKTPAKFQKDPAKTVGGVAFSRYPVSKCFRPKNNISPNCERSNKINLRIAAKYHAHLETLKTFPAKFQNDLAKTAGEVAFTRHPGLSK